jgi:hypothetical protein
MQVCEVQSCPNNNKIPKPPPTRQGSRKPKAAGSSSSGSKAIAARNSPSLIIAGSLLSNVLPRSLMRTLRYAESYTLTTGAAGVVGTVQLMVLNGVYDPNATGVGHQPYGFDQLTPFYGYYLVKATKYRILVTTIGSTAEVAVCFQIYPAVSGVSIAGSSVDAATEKSTCTVFPVGPSGVDRARLIEGKAQMHNIFGITPAQYKNEQTTYGAAVTAGPSAGAYLEIGAASYSGVSGTTISVQVVLDFDVEFFQPKTLPQS